jgi:hypothetical protein
LTILSSPDAVLVRQDPQVGENPDIGAYPLGGIIDVFSLLGRLFDN